MLRVRGGVLRVRGGGRVKVLLHLGDAGDEAEAAGTGGGLEVTHVAATRVQHLEHSCILGQHTLPVGLELSCTHTHTYTQNNTHTHTHTSIHTSMQNQTHTHKRKHTDTHSQTRHK